MSHIIWYHEYLCYHNVLLLLLCYLKTQARNNKLLPHLNGDPISKTQNWLNSETPLKRYIFYHNVLFLLLLLLLLLINKIALGNGVYYYEAKPKTQISCYNGTKNICSTKPNTTCFITRPKSLFKTFKTNLFNCQWIPIT